MTYRSPRSTRADLRSQDGWSSWLRAQAEVDAKFLAQAAMEYRAEQDTIHLIFHRGILETYGSGPWVARRVADLMQAFYAERRACWLDDLRSAGGLVSVPQDVVMPRLEIEVTPPCRRAH
jgi:hypothetical protein